MLWLFPSCFVPASLQMHLLIAQLTATNSSLITQFYLPVPQYKIGLVLSSTQFSQNTEIPSMSKLDETGQQILELVPGKWETSQQPVCYYHNEVFAISFFIGILLQAVCVCEGRSYQS